MIHKIATILVLLCAAAFAVPADAAGLAGRLANDYGVPRPFLPVTLSQAAWHFHGPRLIYSRWPIAFRNFSFYGRSRRNWLYAGGRRTMSIEGSASSLTNLINWLPQTGPPSCLKTTQDWNTPAPLPSESGSLAGEVVALTMNVAFNDTRVMPRQPGYDLEAFRISRGLFRWRTVGEVLHISNRVLGGDPPVIFGLSGYQELVDILSSINSNYEFRNYGTYVDRGYLIPNRPLGRPDPPHDPHVP